MKKIGLLNFIVIAVLTWQCTSPKAKKKKVNEPREHATSTVVKYDSITIRDNGLTGYFKGPEYNEQGDIAHQFSNKVAKQVGEYLKARYTKKCYLKIDLDQVKITTEGLDQQDSVYYTIAMPFKRVKKCDAFTGIEHCGSWNYQPKFFLNRRFNTLKEHLAADWSVGKMEYKYYKSAEGFQEYWIQFKHKDFQQECSKQ